MDCDTDWNVNWLTWVEEASVGSRLARRTGGRETTGIRLQNNTLAKAMPSPNRHIIIYHHYPTNAALHSNLGLSDSGGSASLHPSVVQSSQGAYALFFFTYPQELYSP
ncbi:hypothetical protein WG66_007902 [Moniliophthora roreri]|nr:hypothetical protein WG66_007902 [Moniliophthora roreri]